MSVDNVTIRINTSNDAFVPDLNVELARILRELADEIETNGVESVQALHDVNGGFVGEITTCGDD